MTIGSILLGFALLILVALFLGRPFLKSPRPKQSRLTRREILLAEKEAILAQIRDLDFDHDTGKMPDEIHQAQRAYLMNSAAATLKQLDELEDEISPTATGEADVDAAIEAAISRLRQSGGKKAVTAASSNGKGGFCPQCGQPVAASDNFCTSCGHKLRSQPVP